MSEERVGRMTLQDFLERELTRRIELLEDYHNQSGFSTVPRQDECQWIRRLIATWIADPYQSDEALEAKRRMHRAAVTTGEVEDLRARVADLEGMIINVSTAVPDNGFCPRCEAWKRRATELMRDEVLIHDEGGDT